MHTRTWGLRLLCIWYLCQWRQWLRFYVSTLLQPELWAVFNYQFIKRQKKREESVVNKTRKKQVYLYNWPLEQHGFEPCGPTCTRMFFNKYLYCSQCTVWSPRTQRANCMHWCMPFYIQDLKIHRFWYPWGSWNQPPAIPREN